MHRRIHGFAICIHTCVDGGCLNRSDNKLWARDGASLRKHAVKSSRHPNCTTTCPGYDSLGKLTGSFLFWRSPTNDELGTNHDLGTNNEPGANSADDMAVDLTNDDIPPEKERSFHHLICRSTTPRSESSSAMGLSDGLDSWHASIHAQQSSFHILYIPDPTRVANRMRAEGDLAFVKTTITH